jgi:hypothetical protein
MTVHPSPESPARHPGRTAPNTEYCGTPVCENHRAPLNPRAAFERALRGAL